MGLSVDLVMHHGPWVQIWLCAMGQSVEFGCKLWAMAQNLVMC
jgi:hypothetical protein